MRRFKAFLLPLIGFLLAIMPLSTALKEAPAALQIVAVLGIAGALAFSKTYAPGAYTAGVAKEVWQDYIVERFWKDNVFLKFFRDAGKHVLVGKVVHIPNPGAKPAVVKNRSEFPATAVRRTDTDITYSLDEYSVDPTHVHNLDKIEPSYDALDEAYGDQMGSLNDVVADDMIIKVLSAIPAGNIIRTSGAAIAAYLAGQTGNRKGAVHGDVLRIRTAMSKQGVPDRDRYALLDEDMYAQIFASLSDTQANAFNQFANTETGVLGKLYGFLIMTRASVAAASSADVIRALGAAVQATDNAVSLFWQKDCVEFALGEVKVFDDTDNPLYYGDLVSSAQRAGGRRRREDNAGVIAYIQDAAA
ncbi:hypothetical protein [Pedobacter zeae]|uniref:Uncharacterized protein n=1 Tax=Pedobacter zeae TaxID=1737356 RepID=A0A7W6P3M4_9SPHI|nr:hypothetical protein [Pedobacter zeae]MBB4106624.1 hypothetical protein [Pedobacter zeae]GGH02779.1 hypothetical protein GCM10007422_17440 [Pedobacter zeae]